MLKISTSAFRKPEKFFFNFSYRIISSDTKFLVFCILPHCKLVNGLVSCDSNRPN